MRYFPILCCLLLPAGAAAQNSYNWWDARKPAPVAPAPRPAKVKLAEPIVQTTDSVALTLGGKMYTAELVPSFPGGNESLYKAAQKQLKRPKGPRMSGRVQVTFTVLASGVVTNAHVKPGNGLNAAYDAAAVEFVSGLPRFSGGKRNGQPTDMEITLPFEFR